MKIKTALQAAGLKKVYDYIDKDPHARLPQVISLIEKFVPSGSSIDGTIKGIKEGLSDPGNNWNRFVMNLWDDIDDGARRAVFENFAVNGTFLEADVNESLQEKYDCNIPWTMLIDPTSACNLHCTGCWAAEYGSKLNLSYEELDGIIRQGKELGIHFSSSIPAASRWCARPTSSACARRTRTANFPPSPTAPSSTRHLPTRCCA